MQSHPAMTVKKTLNPLLDFAALQLFASYYHDGKALDKILPGRANRETLLHNNRPSSRMHSSEVMNLCQVVPCQNKPAQLDLRSSYDCKKKSKLLRDSCN
jgi:hypothetical protein